MEEFDRKKTWSIGKQGKHMFTSLQRRDQYFNIKIQYIDIKDIKIKECQI